MKKNYALLLTFILILIGFSASQINAQVVLTTTADTYVRGGTSAAVNWGNDTIVRVRARGSSNDNNWRRALIKFDLSTISNEVSKAELLFTVERTASSTGLDSAYFYKCDNDLWEEMAVVWDNAPERGEFLFMVEFARVQSTAPRDTTFDVTSYVNSQINGDKTITFFMAHDLFATGTDLRIYSKEAVSQKGPRLVLHTATDVEDELNNLPTDFIVEQNYPNPFNPETVVSYNLPSNGKVSVEVYNLLGQKISTLFEGELGAGKHQINWNGKNEFGIDVNSGVYFARITFGQMSKSIKMLLAR